jgi:hypothetical protein
VIDFHDAIKALKQSRLSGSGNRECANSHFTIRTQSHESSNTHEEKGEEMAHFAKRNGGIAIAVSSPIG